MSDALRAREEAIASERRRALRRLLREPLLLEARDPDAFAAVVRHRAALGRWFAEHAGWSLVVEAGAGYARLMKRSGRRDTTRPARPRGRPAFDRRRYTLLFLALAALDDGPPQTTLARLAESVRDLSLEDPSLAPFDPDQHGERAAFVDVLRLLDELGVLVLRDGDAERYARSREGDALYDVRERLLGQLLAAPVPPSLAGSPERMMEEERAHTEEGERVEARHAVFRRLLDEPVVYLDDLPPRAREWLEHGKGFLYERLEGDVGLVVERRREG
ncbi:MAG TPA: TIGR02678 family protein, partial [Anaeromyxobacteraceae bacterium]|nr:TIGR02678 family protein [Anaeromyxobacteraceae bacterium]